MSLSRGSSKLALKQVCNIRCASPLLQLQDFTPEKCFIDAQHIIYEGIFLKTVRILFPHGNSSGELFSKANLTQITRRLRIYPFLPGQHSLDSLVTKRWTSSQFMNLLEALPIVLRNMLSPCDCNCGIWKLPQVVSRYYKIKNCNHTMTDHYLHIVEVELLLY